MITYYTALASVRYLKNVPELSVEADFVSLPADCSLALPLVATVSWWATSLCVRSASRDRHSLLMAFQLWG